MGTVAMILRKAPYGSINAAEAVRHALGGVSDGLTVNLILIDTGVLLAKKEQDDAGVDITNIEGVLWDCIEMGVAVYTDKHSMQEQHLNANEIIDGVKVVNGTEIAEMVKEATTTMVF